eukprot:2775405-Prymnesium_polylepis.1
MATYVAHTCIAHNRTRLNPPPAGTPHTGGEWCAMRRTVCKIAVVKSVRVERGGDAQHTPAPLVGCDAQHTPAPLVSRNVERTRASCAASQHTTHPRIPATEPVTSPASLACPRVCVLHRGRSTRGRRCIAYTCPSRKNTRECRHSRGKNS